ncbi:MAG: coproporphyrinogen III oxidase family protein [Fusobacterium necrophorum]|nr:coproporphyrinogen III oxidase family protein [Fusobacterium necrophorum]
MWNYRYKTHHDVEKVLSKLIKNHICSKHAFLEKLEKANASGQLSLYVHTPYCDTICSFCNLNRRRGKKEIESYSKKLCEEIRNYTKFPFCQSSEVDVIFFGGGTPTIYTEIQLENILKAIHSSFRLAPHCEFTFETTLHNLSQEKIALLEKYGVNRLSIGIQTFSTRGRKILNRSFPKEIVLKRLHEIHHSFHGTLCIDIIYNYPQQTIEELLEDVHCISDCHIDSVSFYSLIVEEKSKLFRFFQKNPLFFEHHLEKDEEFHHIFCEQMLQHGYHLLELTKFVKKDKYQYIQNNYQARNLLPIGSGSGGRIEEIACYHMNSNISFYLKYSSEYIQKYKLLGLFQFPSIPEERLQSLSEESYERIRNKMEDFVKQGYFSYQNHQFIYTIAGIFWGNNIAAEILKLCS